MKSYKYLISENHTHGQVYEPAMAITTKEEADLWLNETIEQFSIIHNMSKEEAEATIKSNLGYYAGYYSNEARLRVEKLFNCEHPIFGKAENGFPTTEEAYKIGLAIGLKSKKT